MQNVDPYSFMSITQAAVVRKLAEAGEESSFFRGLVEQIAETLRTMPRTYEQDGKGDQAIVYVHLFTSGGDWWITELDKLPGQHQAFGLVDLGYGPELGYVSIPEVVRVGAELDLHFHPTTLAEVRKKHDGT